MRVSKRCRWCRAWLGICVSALATGCGGSAVPAPETGQLLENTNGRLSNVCTELEARLATASRQWPAVCPRLVPRGELRAPRLFPIGPAGDFTTGYGINASSTSEKNPSRMAAIGLLPLVTDTRFGRSSTSGTRFLGRRRTEFCGHSASKMWSADGR